MASGAECRQLWSYLSAACMAGSLPAAKTTSLPDLLHTGDAGKITVGNNTSIQDGAIIRTAAASALDHETMHATHDTVIGNNVTVGHQVDTQSSTSTATA